MLNRSTLTKLTAVTALVAGSVLPAGAASAQDSGRVVIDLSLAESGGSALDTSILASQQTFQSADEVIVATAADGADALASGSLQSGVGGAAATTVDGEAVEARPLFLVDPTEELPLALLQEMQRLGASRIIVLGGESAIPADIADGLENGGSEVSRMGGTTRLATAVEIAEYVLAQSDVDVMYLSRAFGTATDSDTAFADSSALGGWAASSGAPILLTETESLSLETQAFLLGDDVLNQVSTIEIIGGPAAISEGVEGEVADGGMEVTRIGGNTRDETAVDIAEARGMTTPSELIVTEGFASDFFVSSFTIAAYSGLFDAPVVLSNTDLLPNSTIDFIGTADPALADSGVVAQCTPAVVASVCAQVADLTGAQVQEVGPGGLLDGGGSGAGDLPI
ncbi:MAG: cell wall-binding repeat-containing protein [Euzebya sp.]